MRRYAAEVSGVDDGVGRVLEALRTNGLEEQTVVVFAADQGLCGGQHGIWGMGDHTRPLGAFDEMMHVPLIWRRPGGIRAGRRSELMVSNYDFLPTVLDVLGVRDEPTTGPTSPGRSYAAELRGEQVAWGDAAYYEFENVRAIRTAEWKYVERFPEGPNELYDLTSDPGERTNLVGQRGHAAMKQRLAGRLTEFFDAHADSKYDLKRGGRSKTPLHVLTPAE
jgi:arylsulfatase A-like enzyme